LVHVTVEPFRTVTGLPNAFVPRFIAPGGIVTTVEPTGGFGLGEGCVGGAEVESLPPQAAPASPIIIAAINNCRMGSPALWGFKRLAIE
jgi:hypothetical protein